MANKPGEANFFPDIPVYPEMGTFQPVYGKFDLTTYIQGASDYEIMAFLVGKYNACLEAYGTVTKLSTDTITACKQLQDWINNWFDNLDVQQELNNKIDQMVADGSFGTLLHQTFDTQINQQTTNAVTEWLVANVTPTGSAVVVDKSLSIEGAAADAKVTGARTSQNLNNAIAVQLRFTRGTMATDYTITDSKAAITSSPFDVYNGDTLIDISNIDRSFNLSLFKVTSGEPKMLWQGVVTDAPNYIGKMPLWGLNLKFNNDKCILVINKSGYVFTDDDIKKANSITITYGEHGDSAIVKSKISDYFDQSYYITPQNNDYCVVTDNNDAIPYDAEEVTVIYNATATGSGVIALINVSNSTVVKVINVTAKVGKNTVIIDTSDIYCRCIIGFKCNTTGVFTTESAIGSNGITFPWGNIYAFYTNDTIELNKHLTLNYWSGNISTNKTYPCARIYIKHHKPVDEIGNIIVGKGRKYETINSALRRAGDIGELGVTITLLPGYYKEVVYLMEDNAISLQGLSRDSCVLYMDTGKYMDSPLVVNCRSNIQNLTCALYNTQGFVPTYSDNVLATYPGYAIHVDGEAENVTKRLFNVVAYSEAFPAVGAGTNKNQTVIFEQCEFTRNCYDANFKRDSWQGAMVMHASNLTDAENSNFTIKDCTLISNYGNAANIRGDLAGSSDFTMTAINNTFYSKEFDTTNCVQYDKGNSKLSKMSHGNTAANLNS